jgi:tetratricopeptide (TPR) repeat protein/adenylate kinase family enzyme
MNDSGIASRISFSEVRALAGQERWETSLIDGLDRFLGVAILLTPALLGPAGIFALSLLEPKDELVKIGKSLVKRFASSNTGDFVARRRRMAAAYCLMTYTAFFAALDLELPEFTKSVALTDNERAKIVDALKAEDARTVIEVPHPTMGPNAERDARVALYGQMAISYVAFVQGLAVWDVAPSDQRQAIQDTIQAIPERAAEVFDAQYLALLIEYPAFHRWAELYELTRSQQLTSELAADLQQNLILVADAIEGIDIGFRNLDQLVNASAPSTVADDRARRIAQGLHAEYDRRIKEPVIDASYTDQPNIALVFPKKCEIFIPQAFQAIRHLGSRVRLELDSTWSNATVNDDLGAFTMRYLDSNYSIESPLLILGHPGSGKSLFTEMVAACFAPPAYHPIRIELRDVDADAELQDQIERQIRRDTGHEVNWAVFAEQLRDNPPVIILDGYDELLQASGKVFSNYLARVQAFQRREAVQGRPVRVIVTSRITLIDKAVLPEGITVLRLLDFDPTRRDRWTEVWNAANSAYFASADVQPFSLSTDPRILNLAAQPLLLLMLAVYDSDGNQLRDADLDRTLLYHNLLVRFIERERTKGDSASEFMSLTSAQRDAQIESDLERLGVAAVGMFNRRALHIKRDDLDRDIAYFGLAQDKDVPHGATLTQAELLLGSFFFIHESKSQGGPDTRGPGVTAFEFLHNTFGEFLTADYILRRVLSVTHIVRTLGGGDPRLLATREQHLEQPPKDWLAGLIYTSLHTRPAVCSMMREWLSHRLAAEAREPAQFEEDLTLIVVRQLKEVLCGNAPPAVMQQVNETPFESLPILGHLAVYSLNLILLLLTLTRVDVNINEAGLGTSLAGCRPWDRLVNLWRSWFSLESLAGLPMAMQAHRSGDVIILSLPHHTPVRGATTLADIYNIAEALADTVLCGLTAPHLFDISSIDMGLLSVARERLTAGGIDLSNLIDARMTGHGALWLEHLGKAMARLSRFEESEYHLQRALAIYEQSGDQVGVANCCRELSEAKRNLGAQADAEILCRRALEILTTSNDLPAITKCRQELGRVLLAMGRFREAEVIFGETSDIFGRLGDRLGLADSLSLRGQAKHYTNDLEEARSLIKQALDVYTQLDNELGVVGSYNRLGTLAYELGMLEEAEVNYRMALSFFPVINTRDASYIATEHGKILAQLNRHTESVESLLDGTVSWYTLTGNWAKEDLEWLLRERDLIAEAAFAQLFSTQVPPDIQEKLNLAMDDVDD